VVSPYAWARQNDPKELLWKKVGLQQFSMKPSRFKSVCSLTKQPLKAPAALGFQTKIEWL
jgi:hypothetical protein